MLAAEDCYEREFERALALHGQEMGFERARTQLAREALHQALAYFERGGAEPWAEQARAELRATGESPLPRPPAACES